MTELLATYVHHLDPFAIQFTETFGLRWYGLAYVAGFFAAFLLIRWFVSLGLSELRKDQVADFITVGAILGVMVGGRLGFMLLYNWDEFSANPLSFFNFLGGGMASHGGIAGLAFATWVYARYTKKSWLGLGDNLVVTTPLGLFFGRIANFVNGELYGRATTHPWAMKFPGELSEVVGESGQRSWMFPTGQLVELAHRAGETAPELATQVDAAVASAMATGQDPHRTVVGLVDAASLASPGFRTLLGEILTPRHPSQLYEAAIEGLLLFVILLTVRLRWRNLAPGILTGLFFILYAVGRIAVENLREPDSEMIAGMTRGQFYSLFMIVAGFGFIGYGIWTRRRKVAAP